MAELSIEDLKKVELYAAGANAWVNTSLERDKSLLALSAGGIGLLVTLTTTVGVTSHTLVALHVGAVLSFLSSLIAVLIVLEGNKASIRRTLQALALSDEDWKKQKEPRFLAKLDRVALASFLLGVLLTTIIGITTAVDSYRKKSGGQSMATKDNVQTHDLGKSFHDFSQLDPRELVKPEALRPDTPAPAPAPTASDNASGSAAPESSNSSAK